MDILAMPSNTIKMDQSFKRNLVILDHIVSMRNKEDRDKVLQIVLKDKEIISAIRQIATNLLQGYYTVEDEGKRAQLKEFKQAIIDIHKKKSVIKTIEQHGYGFLPILLPILLSLIESGT